MTDKATSRPRRPRRKVLTDRMVETLPRRPQPYFHPDPELPKHGIRVRPAGPCAYTVITRDPYGKQRWTKIGSTAELNIAEARDKAREVIKRVEAGLEPFERPKPKPESVAVVAASWLDRYVDKNKLRSASEQRRIVTKYILPVWRDRTFIDIKRRDIAELLDHIEDKNGSAMADRVLATLRAMASWVQSRDDDYKLPFTRNMRRVPVQDRKRSRVLSDDELRRVWHAAGNDGVYGVLIRLLLLTAQRRQTILNMRWSAIAPTGVWTIPNAPREKGHAGRLQLPLLARAVLKDAPRFVGNDYVLAGNGRRRRMFNLGQRKHALDKASGTADWRLHDLRRTARSLMPRAGVSTEIAERVLGHARPAMEGTYNLHPFDDEKAAALAALADLIERIVTTPPPAKSEKVVTLSKAAVS
jgi:integrase